MLIMGGTVRTQHLFTCAAVIIREFGPRVYLRCILNAILRPGRTTFLESIRLSESGSSVGRAGSSEPASD